MLRNALIGAILLPFMAASGLAQDRTSDHHYQGGPKTEVPHHIGPRATGNTGTSQGTPSQAGQHHYQGGPQSIHHIGEMPKTTGEAPKQRGKAKRNQKSQG